MIYGVFCIRDSKVGFMTPTIDQNESCAIRNFEYAAQRTDSLFNSHPSDFDLYRIGSYDSESGELTSCLPEHLCSASDLLKD